MNKVKLLKTGQTHPDNVAVIRISKLEVYVNTVKFTIELLSLTCFFVGWLNVSNVVILKNQAGKSKRQLTIAFLLFFLCNEPTQNSPIWCSGTKKKILKRIWCYQLPSEVTYVVKYAPRVFSLSAA